MKKLILLLFLLLPLPGAALALDGRIPKARIASFITEYRHCEGVEMVRLGRISTAAVKGVVRVAAAKEPDAELLLPENRKLDSRRRREKRAALAYHRLARAQNARDDHAGQFCRERDFRRSRRHVMRQEEGLARDHASERLQETAARVCLRPDHSLHPDATARGTDRRLARVEVAHDVGSRTAGDHIIEIGSRETSILLRTGRGLGRNFGAGNVDCEGIGVRDGRSLGRAEDDSFDVATVRFLAVEPQSRRRLELSLRREAEELRRRYDLSAALIFNFNVHGVHSCV